MDATTVAVDLAKDIFEMALASQAELSPRTFCTFLRELSPRWRTHAGGRSQSSSMS